MNNLYRIASLDQAIKLSREAKQIIERLSEQTTLSGYFDYVTPEDLLSDANEGLRIALETMYRAHDLMHKGAKP